MYTVMKCRYGFFAFLFMAVVAVGCKKDTTSFPAPAPVTQQLTVNFSAVTIPFQHVDFAVVLVRDANQYVKKEVRLQNRTN